MKLGYILNTYPQPSHSFIRREIQALERQGFVIDRLAMRRASVGLVDPQDQAEADRTQYVLDAGSVGLLMALLGVLLRGPVRGISALVLTWRMGRVSHVGVLRHVIYLAEAAWVLRQCQRAGIAHCHAHFGTNAAAVALLCRTLGGPPFSFTTHGPEEFDAPRALSLGAKLDHAAFAVGVSQFGRSQLSRWAGFTTWERLHVVHCGIEPTKFVEPVAMPEGPVQLVSIGRFVEQKGQMVLVEAMARVRDSHPNVHLTLVGDGEMRAELETAIDRHGLTDRITLTGWVSEAEVTARLQGCHALVMPSFAEGLPMVVMEAMAAQRPVIATYVAGTPELVRDGETGWLVPAGDCTALAAAIVRVADTGITRLSTMGRAGYARVMQRHDVDTQAAKLAGLFRQSGP
ncbi:glycosyltransferase family 4 protein [Aliisedimentitalea scapharcae]|uniref:Glycosyltransferase family 4 protein n=1 Tax=Aliisedimentitalea scapharcae TaxID=1524259 RepID=A0ABZ2XXE3_9RHOB|nr:glycosyltransferase family 4 protein [Rhodobacteraceae bacterium M382]